MGNTFVSIRNQHRLSHLGTETSALSRNRLGSASSRLAEPSYAVGQGTWWTEDAICQLDEEEPLDPDLLG